MGRIRTIKPEFFQHEELYDLESETGVPIRTAFSGLWTQCDREGRFEWRPRRLKVNILPYDPVDFGNVLEALESRGFVRKYAVNGHEYGYIPSWHTHQSINQREAQSKIPAPPDNGSAPVDDSARTETHMHARGERKGKEGKGKEGKEKQTAPRSNGAATPDPPPEPEPVITLPLNDKTEYAVTATEVEHWRGLYPGVDVDQQLRNMRGWLDSNPTKRKTRRGVERFITGWLAKEQDRGGAKRYDFGGGQQTTGKISRAMAALNNGGKP